MSRRQPVLTIAQYRERTRLLRAEVGNAAWSLVVSPADSSEMRRWRPLTAEESMDLFDRLFTAITRHASTDSARVV